jgi:hypothetical protein
MAVAPELSRHQTIFYLHSFGGMVMRDKRILKGFVVFSAMVVMLITTSSAAYSWGWAAHTYINDQLSLSSGGKKKNEIYGGMAADSFIFMLDDPTTMQFLHGKTHTQFMSVWENAQSASEKSTAFGFVSHNDSWGADYTAHHAGRTFGNECGYVIAKAANLKDIMIDKEVIPQEFLDLMAALLAEFYPEEQVSMIIDGILLTFSHEFIEYAVDILMKDIDPQIGVKVKSAAASRSQKFPRLLAKTYGKELSTFKNISEKESAKIIMNEEKKFKKRMMTYGKMLSEDQETAVQLVSMQLVEIARAFLAGNKIVLPSDLDLTPLAKGGILGAMALCAPDFQEELQATVEYLRVEMSKNEVSY